MTWYKQKCTYSYCEAQDVIYHNDYEMVACPFCNHRTMETIEEVDED